MKSMKRTLVSLLFAVAAIAVFPGGASAQWVLLDPEANALVSEGLDHMYNLRYTEADSVFRELAKKDPTHPAGFFLMALVDWWKIVPNTDVESKVSRFSETFNKKIDKVLEVSDARLETNPADIIGLFFKASALGYRARLVTLTSGNSNNPLDMLSGIMDGNKAYEILLLCQRLAPSNRDILLGSGLFQYMSAYLPEKYPALKPMLGFLPPGDKQLGLNMLRIASENARYASTEAKYSLLEIVSLMEKDYAQGKQIAYELHQKFPGNPVFYKFFARNAYLNGDNAVADSAWYDILRKVDARESGYELTLARQGLYYLGDIRFQAGNLESALRLLQQADRLSERLDDGEENSWAVMTHLKMAYIYDKQNRRKEALREYERVLDMDDYNNSHTNAKKYMAEAYR
jgi:tetratricopeptide (TPR) repeat protein